MDKVVTMRRKTKGIDITVVIKENCYDFYIDITPEVDLSKKIVEKDYTMKLRFHDGRKTINEPIHLEILNKKYRDNEVTNHSKFSVKNEEYRFEISLSPKLYVLPNKLREAEKKQKSKKKAKIKINGLIIPGLASSKIIKYSQSNISRPYSGGRCTPKWIIQSKRSYF